MAGPLHRALWVVVAAALLPVAALSAVALTLLQRQQVESLSKATIETMRALVSATDTELEKIVAVAEALAVSNAFDKRKLDTFYREAQRVAQAHPEWVTLALSDPTGQRLVDVRMPLGTELGSDVESTSFQRVLEHRVPAVGTMQITPDATGFAVRVPVMREEAVRYVLTVMVSPTALLDVIRRQRIPPEGVVSIFDAQGHHVARSRNHEGYLGSLGSAELREMMANRSEGWGESVTFEGQPIYAAFSRSSAWGWSVAVGVPASRIVSTQQRSFATFGVGFVLSMALGALASLLMARNITRPIGALRRAAQAVGRGEIPQVEEMHIAEIQEVADALAGAAKARSAAEAAREELLVRERDARTAAEQANRSKDEFLAMLGHELRNPLAAISNATQLMAERGAVADTDSLDTRPQEVIERQTAQLVRLVDDLLDVARVVRGKIILDRRTVDLAGCARESVETLRAGGHFDAHSLEVETRSVWIEADATRVEQMVNNLLVNAVKYTPDGGHIRLFAGERDRQAVVEVCDDGVGIGAELLPDVFELFRQGERAIDRSQGGLGIGLTLVRRLAELHGGSIGVSSEGEGKGSQFTLYLPVVEAPRTTPAPRAPSAPACSRRVLIVEDNEDAREMLRAVLEARGHHVSVAADGPEGVERAIAQPPEVAFVDLGLPGIDGFEVARRIRAHEGAKRQTLLVALSGYGAEQDREQSQIAGFDRHLVKPVSRDTLVELLAELPSPGERAGGCS